MTARSGKLWGWRIYDGDLRRSEDEDDDDGILGDELPLGNGHHGYKSAGSSSRESTSDGDYDKSPRRRARTGESDEPSHHRASVKQEEDFDSAKALPEPGLRSYCGRKAAFASFFYIKK